MKKYDIFISYRRSSYDTANLVATRLRAVGYSVFFDMETLRSGKFNEQLYEVIDNCTDFIVVLPPNALDRCVSEDDWVRLEVCRAIKGNKNVVPIMLNGFVWPNPMPTGMEELSNYQALTASSIEYFDLAMERLQKRYLRSKRHFPIIKWAKYLGVTVAALLLITAILWGVFSVLSKDVCQKYATALTKDANYVYMIADENNGLEKDWREFDNTLRFEGNPERKARLQEEMLKRIDLAEKNITRLWQVDSIAMEISPYHSFLLSLNGINAEEIALSPTFATLYYTDYLEQLGTLRNTVQDPNTRNRRFSMVQFEVFEHSVNSYYISLLSELSRFPKTSLAMFNELYKKWIYFPTQVYKLGEDREYYEAASEKENGLVEAALSRFESVMEQADAELMDIESSVDEVEKQIEESFSSVQSRIDSTTAIFNNMAQAEQQKKQNATELAIRKEKVKAKEIAVKASKAELEELDKQYVAVYNSLKEKCAIEQGDDQWYQWGKICHMGNYLSMLAKSRQELLSQGIYSTSSITPEVVYADVNSSLTVYQTYHHESAAYVTSAKQFFKDISKSKRAYRGVIIFAFKDDAKHPFFEVGDIIVGYNGKPIKRYEDFRAAYKTDKSGEVEFLRLVDGRFDEMKSLISDTDIVGFLDLTE